MKEKMQFFMQKSKNSIDQTLFIPHNRGLSNLTQTSGKQRNEGC